MNERLRLIRELLRMDPDELRQAAKFLNIPLKELKCRVYYICKAIDKKLYEEDDPGRQKQKRPDCDEEENA